MAVVEMVREVLGDKADVYVPIVNGGVNLSKLHGSMHDTCNTANLVAQKVTSSPFTLNPSPVTHTHHCYSLMLCFLFSPVLLELCR
jgi:hypothetical protein